MAVRFELVALALPAGRAPESLPPSVVQFIAACWPGMSRAQLFDRARRLALCASLRARPGVGPQGLSLFSLMLEAADWRTELVAHVRRPVRQRAGRRAKAVRPPPRDMRQQGLF